MTASGLRHLLTVSRPTGWHVFLLLLLVALGSEYWDKDPLNVGGVLLPWPRFVLALCVLPLIVHVGDWRWSVIRRVPGPLMPLVVFWLCCGFSIVGLGQAPGAVDPIQFLKTFLHLTAYVVFVIVVVKWMTWARLSSLVHGYYALGVVAAGLAVFQLLHGGFGLWPSLAALRFQSAEHGVGEGLTTGFRAASFFGEPSWAARYYVHFIAVGLAFWWQSGRRRHLAALSLFLVAFYAANSLLGYVVLGSFGIAVLLAQMWRRNTFSLSRRGQIALTGAAYAALLLWLLGLTPDVPDLLQRSIARVGLVLQGGGGAGNRIDGVFAGLEVWKTAPIFGVGLGHIDRHIVQYYNDPAWLLRSQYAADSTYVQLLAETGLPGLFGFLWFYARLLSFSRRGAVLTSPEASQAYTWLAFLRVDLFAQAVGMLNSGDYLNPHLWTVVAVTLACKTLIIRDGGDVEVVASVGVVSPLHSPSLA